VQPGDPPRYAAAAPQPLLDRTRAATLATLDALARALGELERPALHEGFWVVRGQEHILAQANTCIAQAQRTLAVSVAPAHRAAVERSLDQARGRGCRVVQPPFAALAESLATVLLVADDREGMVGTLTPADRCQAVVSANPGFVAVLGRFFTPHRVLTPVRNAESAAPVGERQPLDWLDWEERKQRRLLNVQRENRVA
jgi:hypothetical protein